MVTKHKHISVIVYYINFDQSFMNDLRKTQLLGEIIDMSKEIDS